ncbi:MAG: hypothetical protein ACPHID_01320, partial [Thermoplasmatota archaeon]
MAQLRWTNGRATRCHGAPGSSSPRRWPIVDEPTATPKVTLIGTGHVFRIEDTVRDAIIALRPGIVFIELDRGRLRGLMHRR